MLGVGLCLDACNLIVNVSPSCESSCCILFVYLWGDVVIASLGLCLDVCNLIVNVSPCCDLPRCNLFVFPCGDVVVVSFVTVLSLVTT